MLLPAVNYDADRIYLHYGMQVEELDESNNELEDTNTRLEGRALHAEQQVADLKQQLQDASAQVSSINTILILLH